MENPARPPSRQVCCVCGKVTEGQEIEDTNGWRWFSDGRGGLWPLCATCPVPDAFPSGGQPDVHRLSA